MLLDTYKSILIVNVDNVGSRQMQAVRIALRGKAVILMGKNTIMRRVLRERAETDPALEKLIAVIYGNIGFVFTNEDLNWARATIVENQVPAAAKVGVIAPVDVFIPPGPTGLDPGQTNFFQALNIATKIVKGAIEILTQVHLVKAGEKVNASAVSLLSKMNKKPFFYGFKVTDVFEDGAVYPASILDMSDDDLMAKFFNGVSKIAALSLKIGVPNMASIPHSLARGFKNLLALSLATEITFKEAEKFNLFYSDPAAFAAAGFGGGGGGGKAPAEEKAAPAAAAAVAEESESDEENDFNLFD